jgi:hypothetical protein
MKKVNAIPARVPLGIETLGFFKSPDILAPANTPAVAGKKTPNTLAIDSLRSGFELPAAPVVNLGHRLSFSDFIDMPVYLIIPPDLVESENGLTINDESGIENEDTMRITKRTPDARENAFEPTKEMIVQNSNIREAYKNSHHLPYMLTKGEDKDTTSGSQAPSSPSLTPKFESSGSTKPITFMPAFNT